MKVGDKVVFIGTSREQVAWGSNSDPNEFFKVGDVAEIASIETHAWHTKLILVGIKGKFNSVSFVLHKTTYRGYTIEKETSEWALKYRFNYKYYPGDSHDGDPHSAETIEEAKQEIDELIQLQNLN